MTEREKILQDLYTEVARALLDKVRSGEVSAGELNVARQFLKDNGIDATPRQSEPLKQLLECLPTFGDEATTQ